MAELNTLARPYAKAAFAAAAGKGDVAEWSAELKTAAQAALAPRVAAMLDSPAYSAKRKAEALMEVCGKALSGPRRNFIRVLADNRRLPLLPQIYRLFEQHRARREKIAAVEVRTAFPLKKAAADKLAEALGKKLKRAVQLKTVVDEALIGGVLIRAEDFVIDDSLRGRLSKLADAVRA